MTEVSFTTLTNAERFAIWANSCVGSPYLPHSKGVECTPTNRHKLSAEYPKSEKYVKAVCPVISKKIAECHGVYDECKRCKWYNHADHAPILAYGPLELITVALSKVGVIDNSTKAEDFINGDHVIYSGAINYIKNFPNIVCVVFNVSEDTGNIAKIGVYNGKDIPESVVYVKNYLKGVVKTDFEKHEWSHFALIDVLYPLIVYDEMLRKVNIEQEQEINSVYQAKVVSGDNTISLNIRRRPTVNSGIIAQVNNGDTIHVLKTMDNMWVKVMYGDFVGYAVSKYIEKL